jgi:4-hydroxybenzoate polyprenyltransferase
MLAALLEAMRPHQWVKNLLLLAALAFSPRIAEREAWALAFGGFAAFCLIASAVYLINDVHDREADRSHDTKRRRPIASGRLPGGAALVAAVVLLAGGLGLAVALQPNGPRLPFWAWALGYVLLNLAYSWQLKHRVIVDCLAIALGFVIRVHAGAVVIRVPTSSWILMCTFFFALFLAFCKRREEVVRFGEERGATRAAMRDYEVTFLDQMIAPLAALAILSYSLYTVAPETIRAHGNRNLIVTIPFVTFGTFRYLFLVHRRGQGADPARVFLADKQMLACAVLWAAAVGVALKARGELI